MCRIVSGVHKGDLGGLGAPMQEELMAGLHVDRIARVLAREGSRRSALKAIVVGAVGAGMLVRSTRIANAQDSDQLFQQCLAACLAPCNSTSVCPTWEGCAASCSQALW